MTILNCNVCGAELLPATSFCRQCGSAIGESGAEERSEAPTALLGNPPESARTQRLDSRPTSPQPGTHRPPGTIAVASPSNAKRKLAVGGSVLVLLIVGILTTIMVMRMRSANPTSDAAALIYPGASTVLNMANTDGSRTIHLQTKDPLDRVENWYQSNLKLSKTIRLTSASVVMKKERFTITIVEEAGTTNILIKQAP